MTDNKMETPVKMTREEYVAMKLAGIKEHTGLDVDEKALDWPRRKGGFEKLNPGEQAAAKFDFKLASDKDPEKEAKRGLEGYVSARQFANQKEYEAYKARKAAMTP